MKIQFLGTAAAEGIPGLFCTCDNCKKSREIGGRAFRSRSQAIIDDKLLIDFPADTLMHVLQHNVHMENVRHCLITHTHSDHLYPADIRMMEPGFGHLPEGYHMTFYGTEQVGEALLPTIAIRLKKFNRCSFEAIKAFDTFEIDSYKVTALPAIHDQTSGPVFYQISDGEKNLLYGNDTHYFDESVWEYWAKEKPYFDLVSLDCTDANRPVPYIGHMGLQDNMRVRDRMIQEGYADEKTVFICNHFSHNGPNVVYDEFVPIALKEGFMTSYDGMIVRV